MSSGGFGDGFVATSLAEELVDSYESSGGDGPKYGGTKVNWGETEDEGIEKGLEW